MADGSASAEQRRPDRHSRADVRAGLRFGWRRETPLILQAETAECGLACLAMVAGYHGHHVDMLGMRAKFGSSQKGVTLRQMMHVATALGMEGRPLKLDLDNLSRLKLPCILH